MTGIVGVLLYALPLVCLLAFVLAPLLAPVLALVLFSVPTVGPAVYSAPVPYFSTWSVVNRSYTSYQQLLVTVNYYLLYMVSLQPL